MSMIETQVFIVVFYCLKLALIYPKPKCQTAFKSEFDPWNYGLGEKQQNLIFMILEKRAYAT